VAASALVLVGCAPAGEEPAGDSDTGVVIALPEEPRSLASWNAYSNDGFPVLRNIGEALLNRDPVTYELVPELATAWEQSEDLLSWDFTIREGVTFHDGSELTAESAAAALNYVLNPDNAFPMRTFLGPDVVFSALDDMTVRAATEVPDPILPTRLYFVTIPSIEAIEADEAAYETNPIGTGPYKLDVWDRGERIVLVKNDDWWGADSPDAAGAQEITQAEFIFRGETEVRNSLVTTGEADVARWITGEQCVAAAFCESTPTVETVIVRIDTPNPTLSDLRVREAIALSFDKDVILNDILGGGEATGQIVGPAVTGYAGLDPFPLDMERAKALIAEAAADGVDVTIPIQVTARDGFILRANEALQIVTAGMVEAGLTGATSSLLETAAFEEQWTIGYDNIPADRAWVGLQQHGNELLDFSGSINGYYSCDGRTSAFCDPVVEELYTNALQAVGDDRQAKLAEIAEYVYEQVPVVPVGQPAFNFGLSDRIEWKPRFDGFILLKEMSLK
jgi:peptide/nickel transport system substrate-binding protein